MRIKSILYFSLIILLSLVFTACNDVKEVKTPPVEEQEDSLDNENLFKSSNNFSYVIYAAAKKTLDNSESIKKLSYSINQNEITPPRIEYPFGYIKIVNPYRFEIEIPENSGTFIEEKVGFGVLEVIVCRVELLDYDESISFEEDYILFKGSQGIFGCLTNGGRYDWENHLFISEFSTHKTIEDSSVVKDLDKKTIKIYVYLKSDTPIEVRFENWGDLSYYEGIYKPLNNSYKQVSRADVYKIAEFSAPELISCEVVFTTIISSETSFDTRKVYNVGIKPVSGKKLESLEIDNATKIYLEDGSLGTLEDLSYGAILKITYYKYYDEYDPKCPIVEDIYIVGYNLEKEVILKEMVHNNNEKIIKVEPVTGFEILEFKIEDYTYIHTINDTITELLPNQILFLTYREYIEGYAPTNIYLDDIFIIGNLEEKEVVIKNISVNEFMNSVLEIEPIPNCNITKFIITANTVITSLDGTEITVEDLKVDTKVKIIYRKYYNNPVNSEIVDKVIIIDNQ